MVQINDDYYEDLTPEQMVKLIDRPLRAGKTPSRSARRPGALALEPPGGQDTLTDVPDPPVVKTLDFDKAPEPPAEEPAGAEKAD